MGVIILQVVQILAGLVLVFLILLHAPKGSGMASIGAAAQLFSSQSGAESGLNKLTYWTALVFFIVSIIIGLGIIK